MPPQPLGLYLETETLGDVTRIGFRDKEVVLNEQTTTEVATEVFNLAKAMAGRTMLLDFGGVVYLTSTMLGKLMALHKRLQAVGGQLALCNLRPELRELFQITRLDRILNLDGAEAADMHGQAV